MTTNYKDQYIQSILSLLDYVNLNGDDNLKSQIRIDLSTPTNKESFNNIIEIYLKDDNLFKEIFSTLDFFTSNFEILDQNTASFLNGFSATTYLLKKNILGSSYQAGQVFVSYRGTETTDIGDLLTDLKLTFTDELTLPFTSQEPLAEQYLKDAIATYGNVVVSGHSLGGYLAARSYYRLSQEEMLKVSEVTTFNGAGFSIFDFPFITPEKRALYSQKVTNIFSFRGLNVTAGNIGEMFNVSDILAGKGTMISTFEHLGPRIGKFTENPGGFSGNHSMAMLVKTMGFFSILQNLIENVYIARDLNNKTYLNEEAVAYTIDTLLMRSVPEDNDFGKAYDTLSTKLIELLSVPSTLTASYSSPTAKFLSLGDYFALNSGLKIQMLHSLIGSSPEEPPVYSLVDNNRNRAFMYALINNLSFRVVVPETYNNGIYQKLTPEGNEFELNRIYNMAYYSKDHVNLRIVYNKIYTHVLENKLFNNLPVTFEDVTVSVEGFNKFAFIDESNVLGESNTYNIIYVNTNKEEYKNGEVQIVYFKNNTKTSLNIHLDNALILNTPGSDTFHVFSNFNIIRSTYGSDVIYIDQGIGHILMLEKLTATEQIQYLSLINRVSTNLSLTIKTEDFLLTDIILKANIIEDTIKNNIFSIVLGNKYIHLDGYADLQTKDTTKSYNEIYSLIKSFPDLFTVYKGHNLIFDTGFIDDYITITSNRFNLRLEEQQTSFTFSQEHSDFIKSKITAHSNATGINFDDLKSYVQNKVTNYQLETQGLQQDIITEVIPAIQDKLKDQTVIAMISSKLEDFQSLNYNSQIDMNIEDSLADKKANNIYYKKETKNYTAEYVNDIKTWKWDGSYYYNRMENGVQVESFYEKDFKGNLMNYYNENIKIKNTDSLITSRITGSDGSDILIGDIVEGQSDYLGIAGETIITKAGENPNGNDILIGKIAKAFNGNNLIYGEYSASGGTGSDILFSRSEILINHNFKDQKESEEAKNQAIFMGSSGNIFSSNGRNTIIDIGEGFSDSSDPTVNFFATGNDIYIGEKNGVIFIGGYEAFLKIKENRQFFQDSIGFLNESWTLNLVEDFYNSYKDYKGKNNVYTGEKISKGILGRYDYLDLSKGSGTFIGLGNNEIIIAGRSLIKSGGDSNITISGDNNTVYFGKGDVFNVTKLKNNTLYSRGFNENLNLGTDNYTLVGQNNNLFFGKSSYNINLNGSSSNIKFVENRNKNKMIINETEQTSIEVGEQKSLEIISNNFLYLNKGNIEDLTIQTNNTVYMNKLDIINCIIENTEVTNEDYQILLNGDIKIKNFIFRNGNISGLVSGVSTATLEGNLSYLTMGADISGVDLNIKGFVGGNKNTFENVKNFKFIQTLKSSQVSNLEIMNSNIDNYYTEGNTLFSLINSSVNQMNISGNKLIVHTDGHVGTVSIKAIDSLEFSSNSLDSLSLEYQSFKLYGTALKYNITSFNLVSKMVTIDSGEKVIIKSSYTDYVSLSLFNLQMITIEGGFYNAIFTNIDNVSLNIDNINQASVFNIDNANINVVSISKTVSLKHSANKYFINGISFSQIPNSLEINGKLFTKTELTDMFAILIRSTDPQASGLLDNSGIAYESLGELEGQDEFYYDENGIYTGTDGDDLMYATDNKAYHINPKKGNDYIDFGTNPIEIYIHIIEYSIGDGLKTIKSNSENIKLKLNGINSNDLSMMIIPDEIKDDKILNIFHNDIHIFSINGFTLSNITIKAMDKSLTKEDIRDITTIIYGTDGNDVIEGNTDSNTYINAGKGNDIINFNSSYKNVIYYNKGDGLKTINSLYDYEVIFSQDISKNNLRYKKISNNGFELYLDNINIVIINNYEKATVKFYGGEEIQGYYIFGGLSLSEQQDPTGIPFFDENGIYTGTDFKDIFDLNPKTEYHLVGHKGNDIYSFGYDNTNNNIIDYYEGDGHDEVNGSNKKITINLKNMSSPFFHISKTDSDLNSLVLHYKDQKIMTINFINNSNITINLEDKIITITELKNFLYGIWGTDNADIINNIPDRSNYIYAGKGDDIINLTGAYNRYRENNIYYMIGDGHETINSELTFQLLLDKNMNPTNISYKLIESGGTIALNILYENENIITIKKAGEINFSINYLATSEIESSGYLINKLMNIIGTEGNDIINTENIVALISAGDGDDVITINRETLQSMIEGGKNNDIIYIKNLNALNMITYNEGDGYDRIILEDHSSMLDFYMYSFVESDLKFEYDTTDNNHLNIFLNATNEKIITIENYIIDGKKLENIIIRLDDAELEATNIAAKTTL